MKYISNLLTGVLLVFVSLWSFNAHSAATRVESQAEYQDAMKKLKPGDTIIMANGAWKNFEILFAGIGEQDKPIT